MTSRQGKPLSEEQSGVNLEPVLEELGNRGRYQTSQMLMSILASFMYANHGLAVVFIGYQPDYQCSQIDNVTQLEDYLPDDVTNFTLHDVRYQQCSIDVTVNTSGTSSTHSLPCVAGVNFSMPSDTSFVTEWSLVCDKATLAQLIQTAFFAGEVLGCLVSSVLADRYGRKNVYVSSSLCVAITLIITSLVPGYYQFLVGRFIVGFFLVSMIHIAYTMFTEQLPQKWRSIASAVHSFAWTTGAVSMAILAYLLQGISWRYLNLVLCSVFVGCLFLPCFLDESLRWLVATGDMAKVEQILQKACRMNGKDFGKIKTILHRQIFLNDLSNNTPDKQAPIDTSNGQEEIDQTTSFQDEEPKTDVTKEGMVNAETKVNHDDVGDAVKEVGGGQDLPVQPLKETTPAKYTVLDLFRYRVVFVPFLVTVFVWMTNNLYYFVIMLGSAKLSGNRFLNFGLMNLQETPSTIVALFLMRRFNRRPLAFFYSMAAGTFLLLSTGLADLGGKEGATATLATVTQYAGMSSLTGSYVLLFVYYMEVYPTTMRAVGTGTVATIIEVSNMGTPFLLLWAEETPWAPGVLLGCLCCLASLSIWILPETRHRKLPDTIEEIQAWKRKKLVVL